MGAHLDKPEKTIVAVVGILAYLVLAVLLVTRLLAHPGVPISPDQHGAGNGSGGRAQYNSSLKMWEWRN